MLLVNVELARAVPGPAITPRAILRREIKTYAWISRTISGEFTWIPVTYDDELEPITTTGSFLKIWCPELTTWCPVVTYCLGGSAYYDRSTENHPCPTTVSGDGVYVCRTERIYQKSGDNIPLLTNMGCVSESETTRTMYIESPTLQFATTESKPNVRTLTVATVTRTPGAEPSENGESDGPSTGTIAGAAVGGVAGLALIGLGVFLLLRRRRNQKNNETPGPSDPATAPSQPPRYSYAAMTDINQEGKPTPATSYPAGVHYQPPQHSYVNQEGSPTPGTVYPSAVPYPPPQHNHGPTTEVHGSRYDNRASELESAPVSMGHSAVPSPRPEDLPYLVR